MGVIVLCFVELDEAFDDGKWCSGEILDILEALDRGGLVEVSVDRDEPVAGFYFHGVAIEVEGPDARDWVLVYDEFERLGHHSVSLWKGPPGVTAQHAWERSP